VSQYLTSLPYRRLDKLRRGWAVRVFWGRTMCKFVRVLLTVYRHWTLSDWGRVGDNVTRQSGRKPNFDSTNQLFVQESAALLGLWRCQMDGSRKRTFCETVAVRGNRMRTALYARVSKKDSKQDTENQLRQLRQFASTQGWDVVHEYVDRASGKHSDREQFQKMFAAASRREFDILVFWSLDRLSREGTVGTLNHLQRLTGYGVNYRSFTEQYLDSTGIFKEAVIGILAAVAKQERVRLSERTLAGLERARAQGRVGGRPKAEDDAKTVQAVTSLRGKGESIRSIAASLSLSTNTVLKVLKAA
jgi:DNA invertase Pin-like site-specific DNA recombinase